MRRWFVFLAILGPWGMGPLLAAEEETARLKERVAALEEQVRSLQAELAALKGQPLEEAQKALEAELQQELASAPPQPAFPSAVFGGGLWQALNPDLSVIANFRTGFQGRRPLAQFRGSELSEAELALQAATDPFSRLDTFVAIGPQGAELEEATLSILDPSFLRLPRSLQIRLGLLRAPMGQLNAIHPPEQPFADTPLVHRLWFGHEHGDEHRQAGQAPSVPTEGSFTGVGLALSWLLPIGRSVAWLTLAPLNAHNPTFQAEAGRPIWLGRARLFQELSPTQNLGVGLSYASGSNDAGRTTSLWGVDVAYRWRPLREGLYRSLAWQTEVYWARRREAGGTLSPWGLFSLAEYQLSRTLFVGGRYDLADASDKGFRGQGVSLALTLFPSEFGRYRLQWSPLKVAGQWQHEVWLQATFSIGIHRPHPF